MADGGLVAFLFCEDTRTRQGQQDILGVFHEKHIRTESDFYVLVYTHWVALVGQHTQRLTMTLNEQTQEFIKTFTPENPISGAAVHERVRVHSQPGRFADFKLYLDGDEVSQRVLFIGGMGEQ